MTSNPLTTACIGAALLLLTWSALAHSHRDDHNAAGIAGCFFDHRPSNVPKREPYQFRGASGMNSTDGMNSTESGNYTDPMGNCTEPQDPLYPWIIPVAIHYMGGLQFNMTLVNKQIEVLNEVYPPEYFQFELSLAATRNESCPAQLYQEYSNWPWGMEDAIRPYNDIVDEGAHNVYVCEQGSDGAGWLNDYNGIGAFPSDDLPPGLDASYLHPGSMYTDGGGPLSGAGITLAHEVGHWIGLKHVFNFPYTDENPWPWQEECKGYDYTDHVDDTPNQLTPTWGYTCIFGLNDSITSFDDPRCKCVRGRSCGSKDNDQNIMDYDADICRNQVTPGQMERAEREMMLFRRDFLLAIDALTCNAAGRLSSWLNVLTWLNGLRNSLQFF